MSDRPVLKMKHRAVGPRKGTGSVYVGKVTPRRTKARLQKANDRLAVAEIAGASTLAEIWPKPE